MDPTFESLSLEVPLNRHRLFLVCLLAVFFGPYSLAEAKKPAAAGKEKPTPEDAAQVVVTAAEALGGPTGGHNALLSLPGYRVEYRMEVHNTMTGRDYTADHVFERGLDGSTRLEVTHVKGNGVDSVAFAGKDTGWVQVDGEKTEFAAAEVLQRIEDFSPANLFQVPLELGPKGIESLPQEVHSRLTLEPLEGDDAAGKLLVRSVDEAGAEQVRLVFDAKDRYPLEASFASVSGRITYRFSDYRPVHEQLILPFQRVFVRNGILLSDLKVEKFEILGGKKGAEDAEITGDSAPEAPPVESPPKTLDTP